MWKRRIVRKSQEGVPPYYCKLPKEAWRPRNRWFPCATGRDVPITHRFGLSLPKIFRLPFRKHHNTLHVFRMRHPKEDW